MLDRSVPIVMETPRPGGLRAALDALRGWQEDGAAVQLHPGDVGWFWRFGEATTAAALRTWSRAGRPLAVGLLDGPRLLRLAIAPDAQDDGALAHRIADDLQPGPGVLPPGEASVEARSGDLLRRVLVARGWVLDEPWTPLRRDLASQVEDVGLRIEVAGPEHVDVRAAVQRAAFPGSTFTPERWHAMAAGPAYADARCLVGHDAAGTAVAIATVWSAGPGRPGLLEPMGVHPDHRGRGHGLAITLAAAAALRELGSSSAVVCTPSDNAGAVATYEAAGFVRQPESRDLRRAG